MEEIVDVIRTKTEKSKVNEIRVETSIVSEKDGFLENIPMKI
jgi:hypothetical protein